MDTESIILYEKIKLNFINTTLESIEIKEIEIKGRKFENIGLLCIE